MNKKKIRHWLHITLTVLTGGLWLLVYLPILIINRSGNSNLNLSTPKDISVSISTDNHEHSNFYADWKDDRKAQCPYCNSQLKKVPGAKTKCPSCEKYMYVRMDPRSKSQRVVTEEEVELIEDERAKLNGTWDIRLAEKERKHKVTKDLTREFGKEPSENDVKWRLHNQDLLIHANDRNWGLYRNTIHEMAKLTKKEGKLELSLKYLIDIVYIDACGPSNGQGWGDELDIMYLPHFAGEISATAIKLGWNESEMLDFYREHGASLKNSLRLPKTFDHCWKRFKQETSLSI